MQMMVMLLVVITIRGDDCGDYVHQDSGGDDGGDDDANCYNAVADEAQASLSMLYVMRIFSDCFPATMSPVGGPSCLRDAPPSTGWKGRDRRPGCTASVGLRSCHENVSSSPQKRCTQPSGPFPSSRCLVHP